MRKRRYELKKSDEKETPFELAKQIVEYFKPQGKCLEPCAGESKNILRNLPESSDYCEIKEGKDFFNYHNKVDWIITNPPWILFSHFLKHSVKLSDNIVFIASMHYIATKKRLRILKDNNFWLKEILLIDTPKEWGSWGFQLVAFHFQKDFFDKTKISYLSDNLIDNKEN